MIFWIVNTVYFFQILDTTNKFAGLDVEAED